MGRVLARDGEERPQGGFAHGQSGEVGVEGAAAAQDEEEDGGAEGRGEGSPEPALGFERVEGSRVVDKDCNDGDEVSLAIIAAMKSTSPLALI